DNEERSNEFLAFIYKNQQWKTKEKKDEREERQRTTTALRKSTRARRQRAYSGKGLPCGRPRTGGIHGCGPPSNTSPPGFAQQETLKNEPSRTIEDAEDERTSLAS